MHGKITGVQERAPGGAADCYKRRIAKHARPKEYPKYSQACHTCHTRLCTAHGVCSDSRDSTRTEKLTKHAERRLCCCAQRATSGGLLGDTPAHSATHERAKPTGRRSISNLFSICPSSSSVRTKRGQKGCAGEADGRRRPVNGSCRSYPYCR